MTIYFCGSEIGSFTPSDSGTIEETASDDFVRATLICGQGSSAQYAESADFTAPDGFYVHMQFFRPNGTSLDFTLLELWDGSKGVFRILANVGTLQMQYWDGLAWQNAGSSVAVSTAYQDIDLYVDGNTATGTATLYVSGTERATASADLSAVSGVTNLRSYGVSSSQGHYIRQVIVADEPTIGWRLKTLVPTGGGATGDWSGDYTSVDEAVYSDADFIYSGTASQVELFTTTSTIPSGYVVRAVGVYARAKRGASGPSNLQLALRYGGNDYFSSSKALSVGYGAFGNIWGDNPDTGVDWLVAQIASLQFGVKSIT